MKISWRQEAGDMSVTEAIVAFAEKELQAERERAVRDFVRRLGDLPDFQMTTLGKCKAVAKEMGISLTEGE